MLFDIFFLSIIKPPFYSTVFGPINGGNFNQVELIVYFNTIVNLPIYDNRFFVVANRFSVEYDNLTIFE